MSLCLSISSWWCTIIDTDELIHVHVLLCALVSSEGHSIGRWIKMLGIRLTLKGSPKSPNTVTFVFPPASLSCLLVSKPQIWAATSCIKLSNCSQVTWRKSPSWSCYIWGLLRRDGLPSSPWTWQLARVGQVLEQHSKQKLVAHRCYLL